MVNYRSGRQGEPWMENTIAWGRKSRTHQERIGEWLGSGDLDALLDAMEALEKQGAEADSLLRSLVHHDAAKYRAGRKQLCLGLLLIVLTALAIFCWNILSPGIAGNAFGCLLLAIWLVSPCSLSWYEDYRTHGRRLNNAVALLHRMPRPTGAVEMIEALDAGDSRTAALAAKSLVRMLPNLTAVESIPLQANHHFALRRALRGYNSELILAILHASDKILSPACLPDVRWLTHCPDWIAESEKIQAGARRSLALLDAEARRRRTVQTSLRASDRSDAPAEELLRPATSVADIAVHQMLRASSATPSAIHQEQMH